MIYIKAPKGRIWEQQTSSNDAIGKIYQTEAETKGMSPEE
jgi:hypothetical protein